MTPVLYPHGNCILGQALGNRLLSEGVTFIPGITKLAKFFLSKSCDYGLKQLWSSSLRNSPMTATPLLFDVDGDGYKVRDGDRVSDTAFGTSGHHSTGVGSQEVGVGGGGLLLEGGY